MLEVYTTVLVKMPDRESIQIFFFIINQKLVLKQLSVNINKEKLSNLKQKKVKYS